MLAAGILWIGVCHAAHAVDDCRVNTRLLAFGEYVASDPAPLDAVGSIRVQWDFLPGYGRVPTAQNTPPGAYQDSLVVTLIF